MTRELRLRGALDGQDEDIAASLELSLAPTIAAPGRARAAVGDWLGPGILDAPADGDVRLLVTELVSNAVRHAGMDDGEPLRLRAWLRETMLHIEVWDAGADGHVASGPPQLSDDARSGGFGLNLVASLSTDWGVQRDDHGTTVWLELPTATGAAA